LTVRQSMERYIGEYTGKERGPLLVCFGGMHGNEPAGIEALDIVFKLLEREPLANPAFTFKGRIVGLRGNLKAIRDNVRYHEQDLNRMWRPELVDKVKHTAEESLNFEEQELKELVEVVEKEIDTYRPDKVIVLDLHTTTAHGGIFVIASDDPESVKIGVEMHAPVIKGMLKGIKGTTLHFFNTDNFGVEMVAVTFESGQHEDYLSVNRAIAAITNCLRTIGCVKAEDVENRHDDLLIEYSKNLPKVAELITCHHITHADGFRMEPGFLNFQEIEKGEILARDKFGIIQAPVSGHILMPLYQDQGEDGFFLIKPVEGF
jgi:succinylglutamate desuccinylase